MTCPTSLTWNCGRLQAPAYSSLRPSATGVRAVGTGYRCKRRAALARMRNFAHMLAGDARPRPRRGARDGEKAAIYEGVERVAPRQAGSRRRGPGFPRNAPGCRNFDRDDGLRQGAQGRAGARTAQGEACATGCGEAGGAAQRLMMTTSGSPGVHSQATGSPWASAPRSAYGLVTGLNQELPSWLQRTLSPGARSWSWPPK